ncbi:MAG: TRAP transporter small permease [Desulfobacteraceae bacterium]|nr:MAG: TRAP transporter small permease [Desulfobacteraceae bacterium]
MDRISEWLSRIMTVLGGTAVLALMALATGNVCMRMFGAPYRGTYEVVSFLGAITIAFALGYTQKKKSHIVVDVLSDRYSERARRIVDAVSYLLCMVFFAFISIEIFEWGMKIAESGEVSETLKVIYYPFIFSVAIGFFVLTLNLLVDFLQSLLGKEGR